MKRLRDLLSGALSLVAPKPVEPAPPAPLPPHVHLSVGRHVIDGVSVDVPPDGVHDLVIYPLPPGRHIIDQKICYVTPTESGTKGF